MFIWRMVMCLYGGWRCVCMEDGDVFVLRMVMCLYGGW